MAASGINIIERVTIVRVEEKLHGETVLYLHVSPTFCCLGTPHSKAILGQKHLATGNISLCEWT